MKTHQSEEWREFTPHPAAELFPILAGSEMEELVRSIRENGFRAEFPIIVRGKTVIDGRSRLEACKAADVPPLFADYEGDDPYAFIIAANITRRHLTPGQKAGIAADLALLMEGDETRKRDAEARHREGSARGGQQRKASPSLVTPSQSERNERLPVSRAAKAMGVGRGTVQMAKTVLQASPSLHKEVKEGKISVKKAYDRVKGKTPSLSEQAFSVMPGDKFEKVIGVLGKCYSLTNLERLWMNLGEYIRQQKGTLEHERPSGENASNLDQDHAGNP